MSTKKIQQSIAGISLVIAGFSVPQAVYAAESLVEAFSEGKASLNMRYRYEGVDDGNTATDDASAQTLRSRLGFTTGSYKDFKAHVDFEVINTSGNFNSGSNGATAYATVVDPKGEELNQAFISYTGFSGTDLKVGRQRIILDNARFVGNVGWRQNEQTFDAFQLTNKSFEDVTITLAQISQINTITGGETDTSHTLLNVSFDKNPVGKVSAYAYLLDNDASTADTDTLGVRVKGSAGSLLYTAEFAQQSDGGDNPADIGATYLFAEGGDKLDETKLFFGNENLGSDDGADGLQTPLATKHAFNGWADKFRATPAAGLNDVDVKAVTKVAGMKLVGVYHDFSSDEGSVDYGTELDVVLVKPINKTFKGILKFADYSADTFATDTQKIWIALEANFKQ